MINNSESAILDVDVILDYSESLFDLEGSKVRKLDTIPPTVPRTAKFTLKPRGCIHKEEIATTIRYKDHQWKRHTLEMQPKEVHCVCPFLKEKSITRSDFLSFLDTGYLEERGINFEGIAVDKVVDFLFHTCKNRLYRVDEVPIENGAILYLAGDALGEKAYYLLTAVVKKYEGVTQVLLRANSDKSHGLNGFLNEILDNLRHLVLSAEAREIGIIKKEQVINIIDSVVQRTTFAGGEGAASVNIEGSVVQRTEIKEDAEEKRRAREEAERKERERRAAEDQGVSQKTIMAVAVALGVVLIGFWMLAPDSNDAPPPSETVPLPTRTAAPDVPPDSGVTQTVSQTPTPEVTPTTIATPTVSHTPTSAADLEETITNSIGMEFVMIPAGEFDMGSPSDEDGRYSNEGPVHHVTIEKAFYMGRYEVT